MTLALVQRPARLARRAVVDMARRPRLALAATLTLFVSVLLTGLFAATLHGAGRLLAAWAGGVQISVYLEPGADLEAARAAAAAVAPGREVEAVTSDEALRRFRSALGSQAPLADGLDAGVLPPSIEVAASGLSLHEVRVLAARLHGVPGARDVDFGDAWLEAAERLVARLSWVGGALLLALAAGAAVLVANTLRLGVFARRHELEIMRLVGATEGFVRAPFLMEGALQGLAAGLLAAAALLAGGAFALPRLRSASELAASLSRRDLMPPALLAGLVLGGALLGLAASALAVAREGRGSG